MSTPFEPFNHEHWLKRYYFGRAAFSIIWVTLAFTVGLKHSAVAGLLLVIYPLWDALANWIDANASGGLARNRSQRINVWISGVTAVAVAIALQYGMATVIAVIGVWAIGSGLMQLAAAVSRWKSHGAQWAMILSGAQSAAAGCLFIASSRQETPRSIANVAGYAGVGAVYFLVSAVWLAVSHMRSRKDGHQ